MPSRGFTKTPPTESGPHAGWHRAGKGYAWQKVCEAASWRECWLALAEIQGGDKLVLRQGVDANDQEQTRAGHPWRRRCLPRPTGGRRP